MGCANGRGYYLEDERMVIKVHGSPNSHFHFIKILTFKFSLSYIINLFSNTSSNTPQPLISLTNNASSHSGD